MLTRHSTSAPSFISGWLVIATFAPSLRLHRLARACNNRERPGHSHSIVSGTCKRLKTRYFVLEHAYFTVSSTGKKCYLGAIGGDRCGQGRDALAAIRREHR